MNKKLLDLFSLKSYASYVFIMVVCALIISFIDSQLPQGVSVGEAYAILALIGLMAKDSRLITIGATVGTVLTLEGFYISEHGVALWIVWTNRLLAIFIIWVVAFFFVSASKIFRRTRGIRKNNRSLQALKKGNDLFHLA